MNRATLFLKRENNRTMCLWQATQHQKHGVNFQNFWTPLHAVKGS